MADAPKNANEAPIASDGFAILDADAIMRAPLHIEPYHFVFASDAINPASRSVVLADAPLISSTGSIPLSAVRFGPGFRALIDDLESPRFREIVESKFNVDLKERPTTISVRGQLRRESDGYVHTDMAEKIISVLLYLNSDWSDAGGALRILRSKNIDDYALEIPPLFGNMLIFLRSNRSWHGHLAYEGPRMSVQFNWVKSTRHIGQHWRHRFNFLKTFTSFRR
ncbi:MAG TPA: 2OG-Fe(II) oxygenase [Candidatus Binataceae bacterium]|nr:2OG-Fe(II) oxygenase [Candidatus Binataceae bacterium]